MKHLVVVESPTKARTIGRFLGKEFMVEASMGHVRDLPQKSIGVDTKGNFTPTYVIPKEKEAVIKRLQKCLKGADDLWIATDEDREGEAIGWHLAHALGCDDPAGVKRIVFHEITRSAIEEAIAHPRTLDMKLVDAQQARRVLDRLVGYTLSPFLWKKVYSGLSAGRVQSVAVRIIVDREREIKQFVSEEYWTVEAVLEKEDDEKFSAFLKEKDGKRYVPKTEKETNAVLMGLRGAEFEVTSIEEKEVKKNPTPPFTTSTLQQEAGRKLGFSVKQTMMVAQQLYEGIDLGKGQGSTGLITYMRTDSVHLSSTFLNDAQHVIERQFGREYVLSVPRQFKTKSKSAQEAHEAIRPTELGRMPESLKDVLDHQQLKLYTLIWNRVAASQMPVAEFKRLSADICAQSRSPVSDHVSNVMRGGCSGQNYTFRATGQTVLFDGFLRVYSEGMDETGNESDDGEKLLPRLQEGEELKLNELKSEQHFTKPPPRYTEASLVKKLEEEGIGRPSTYAPTISTIQQRGYIRKDGKQLTPENVAFTVTDLLAGHFPNIVDLKFTAKMEQDLDDVADGKQEWTSFLRAFFDPFEERVASKSKEIQKRDVLKDKILGRDPETGLDILVRTGRFGPYIQLGSFEKGSKQKPRTAALPKGMLPEDVMLNEALALLLFPRALGVIHGEPLTVNLGRYGPYIKCGKATVSLSKENDPVSLSLDDAEKLLFEAKEKRKRAQEPLKSLGRDPMTGGEILVKEGRYGPYVTDGKTNASLGKKVTPEDVSFEQAVEMIAKKRAKGPGRRWRKK